MATAMTVTALAVGCHREAVEVHEHPPTRPVPSAALDGSPNDGAPLDASRPHRESFERLPALSEHDLLVIRGSLAQALESSESRELRGLARQTRTAPCFVQEGVARIGLWVQSAQQRNGHRFVWRRALTLGPAFAAEVERNETGWRVKSVGPLHISPLRSPRSEGTGLDEHHAGRSRARGIDKSIRTSYWRPVPKTGHIGSNALPGSDVRH